jgi:hypothetical protein
MAARMTAFLCASLLALASACTKRPSAPPLTADAVYQNEEIGLRFLAPEGWQMRSRAIIPPGKLEKPVILVSYQQSKTAKPAEFGVLVSELAADANLGAFLAEYQVGPDKWKTLSAPQPVTVNGMSATHYTMTRMQAKEEMRREATAFRHGDRVYFFLVTFAASDPASRDTIRTSIESIAWTK